MATFAVTFTRVVTVDVAMPDGPVPKELWNWPTEVVVAATNAAYESIQDVGVDNIEPDTITRLDDETVGPDGEFLPRGRCDTCGAPCDENGCTADRSHEVALDVDEADEGGITPEAQADGHRYVMGNVNAHCPRCATLHFEKTGELITVLTCDFDVSA